MTSTLSRPITRHRMMAITTTCESTTYDKDNTNDKDNNRDQPRSR